MQVLNHFNTTVEKALTEIDRQWRHYDGIVLCGTHAPEGIEQLLVIIREAREAGIPFLGICAGYQLACIEYARNVLGITDATSEEFNTEGTKVIVKRPELKVGLHEGETWWSNYDLADEYKDKIKLPDTMVAVPFHPEYQSSVSNPHPILIKFINICKENETI